MLWFQEQVKGHHCGRTSLAVERRNVEDVGSAALGNTVEQVGADFAAGFKGRGGNGEAGHGNDGDDEGVHFECGRTRGSRAKGRVELRAE